MYKKEQNQYVEFRIFCGAEWNVTEELMEKMDEGKC